MSAWHITGALICVPLAALHFMAAFTPSAPPYPAYGPREASCFFVGIVLTAVAIFCIARLLGAKG
jgi:hypothetical protein